MIMYGLFSVRNFSIKSSKPKDMVSEYIDYCM